MSFPFEYDHGAPLVFGGALPKPRSFDDSRVVILPVPVDRTTSYVPGTRNGPREILQASSHMELWDEELGADVHRGRHLHAAGDGAALRRARAADGRDQARRLGGALARQVSRHARRRALDHAAAGRGGRARSTPACTFCRSTPTPTCATATWELPTTTRARCAAASSMPRSPRSASAACRRRRPRRFRGLRTTIFYDCTMRARPGWIDKVVESLGDPVYITIDVDGMDPAIMPATGTPEPGGLSWYEMLALLRATIERRERRRLRRRRAEPAPRGHGAKLPLRQAHLQDPHLPALRAKCLISPAPTVLAAQRLYTGYTTAAP